MKNEWLIVSDYDCGIAGTKKEAKTIGEDFLSNGATYCFIQYFDKEGPAGKPIYLKV